MAASLMLWDMGPGWCVGKWPHAGRSNPARSSGAWMSMTTKSSRRALFDERSAILVLRVLVGFGFAAHGYAKAERGVEHFALVLSALGLPAPNVAAWLTVVTELLGGIALVAGAFVVPLSLPLAAVMLTAMLRVHLPYGFSSIKLRAITPAGAQFGPVGYEINLLYLAALFVLAVSPPSALSIDAWRKQKPAAPAG